MRAWPDRGDPGGRGVGAVPGCRERGQRAGLACLLRRAGRGARSSASRTATVISAAGRPDSPDLGSGRSPWPATTRRPCSGRRSRTRSPSSGRATCAGWPGTTRPPRAGSRSGACCARSTTRPAALEGPLTSHRAGRCSTRLRWRCCGAPRPAVLWSWTDEEWAGLLGQDQDGFRKAAPGWADDAVRPYLAAHAFLLGGFTASAGSAASAVSPWPGASSGALAWTARSTGSALCWPGGATGSAATTTSCCRWSTRCAADRAALPHRPGGQRPDRAGAPSTPPSSRPAPALPPRPSQGRHRQDLRLTRGHFKPTRQPPPPPGGARSRRQDPGHPRSPIIAVIARRTSRSFVLGFACGRSTWTCGFRRHDRQLRGRPIQSRTARALHDPGLSFRGFARQAGYSESHLRSAENGHRAGTNDVAGAYERVSATSARRSAGPDLRPRPPAGR